MTHWSFGQLATIASAPPNYLRTLPAPIAASAINYGLQRHRREQHQLFVERAAPWTVHAVTSPRYARVHHHELASRVLDLMDQHPAWHLPLGYKDGKYGAERVPSGAYLGDRDIFLFVVDGNRMLDDPTDRTHAGLSRGFILRNSDVGAAALALDVFLYRAVCANHLIGGFQHVAGFRRRHLGASIQDAWSTSLDHVRATLDADTARDRALLLRAMTGELGDTREAVIETVLRRLDLSQKQAVEAYTLAQWMKTTNKLAAPSRAALHAIDLHFHDLRHEGGSRLLEAGWPLHHVQHMLGHSNISQTSTYLNATNVGLQESMRRLDDARCKPVAMPEATEHPPVRNDDNPATSKPLVN